MRKRKLGDGFPPPVIVPPLQLPHLNTLIILHGRGDNGENFRRPLLHHPIPTYDTIRKALPQTKFVFPTSLHLRAKVLRGFPINEWFDYWPFPEHGKDHEPEVEGLVASVEFLHGLIHNAIAQVGAQNVVVGGLSQGCATSLMAMILWDGPAISSWFGMCGWLPFRKPMALVTLDSKDADGEIVSDRGPVDVQKTDSSRRPNSIKWLRSEMKMAQSRTTPCTGPVFLGHGTVDANVPFVEGKEAGLFLRKLGYVVSWREYDGLGHWYSGQMLKDIIEFVRGQLPSDSKAAL